MTTITVHSFKGGTGKSLIAVFLSYYFSKKKEKVLLIDCDFGAPCLETYFPSKGNPRPFTSYLEGENEFKQVVHKTEVDNLFVSYAPHPNFGEKILSADVQTHGRYLKKMLEGLEIAHEKLGFDKVILDNSSGISLASINQLSCCNKSLIVIRPARYGVESTYDLIHAIYKKLRYFDPDSIREDYLIWNQVPVMDDKSLEPRIEEYLKNWTQKFVDSGINHGVTIPYISEVVSAMIADTEFDLPGIAKLVNEYIQEIGNKLA